MLHKDLSDTVEGKDDCILLGVGEHILAHTCDSLIRQKFHLEHSSPCDTTFHKHEVHMKENAHTFCHKNLTLPDNTANHLFRVLLSM